MSAAAHRPHRLRGPGAGHRRRRIHRQGAVRALAAAGVDHVGAVRALRSGATPSRDLVALGDFAAADWTSVARRRRRDRPSRRPRACRHGPRRERSDAVRRRQRARDAALARRRGASRRAAHRACEHDQGVRRNHASRRSRFAPAIRRRRTTRTHTARPTPRTCCWQACRDGRIEGVVLRLPLTYGAGVKGNFARLLDAVAAERRLPLGGIDNRRSFLYVGNAVSAIESSLTTPALAGDDPSGRRRRKRVDHRARPALARALGVAPRLFRVPAVVLRAGAMLPGRRASRRAPARFAGSRRRTLSRARALDAAVHRRRGSRRDRGVVEAAAQPLAPESRAGRRYNRILSSHEVASDHTHRRPPRRRAAPLSITRHYTPARRRLGADRMRRHARAVHGERRGGGAAVSQGQGPGLAHRRIRHAAARDQHAHAARGRRRQAVGTHAGDPAPDRPQPARGRRPDAARRAHDPASIATCSRPTAARAARRSPAPASRCTTRWHGAGRRAR